MIFTARDIVTGALRDLGVITLSESPEAEELDYGLTQLNLLLSSLAAEGVRSWTTSEATVVLAAGDNEVVLTPTPVEVSDARLVMAPTYDRLLYRWNDGEYNSLPSKTQQGIPVCYDLRFTPTSAILRVWPVPNVDTTVAYSYTAAIADVEAGEAIEVPPIWADAVRKMLMTRMTAFMPQGLPDWVWANAEIAKQRLLDFDRPEHYVLGPQYHG